MNNKIYKFLTLLLVFGYLNSSAQCLEVTSIFVDACGPTEGENEMFTFEIGAIPIGLMDFSIVWPNNSFQGWCQDAGTAAATASLNASIISSCGWLLEPAGVLPAGAKVVVISSTNISLVDNSFEGLADTMYIIYQCAGNTAGHFANSGSGIRTLIVNTAVSCVGFESVSYDRSLLLGGDGATVLFDNAGNATYVNNGCNAPVITLSAGWTFTNEICQDYGVVDLNALLAPNATLGGVWTGPRVTGSNYNPSGYLGLDSITYTVTGTGSCPETLDSTLIFQVVNSQSGSTLLQSCDSVFANGTWYSASTNFIDTIFGGGYACDSFVNYTIVVDNAITDSVYLSACSSVSFNGNNYTADIILRDTVFANGGGPIVIDTILNTGFEDAEGWIDHNSGNWTQADANGTWNAVGMYANQFNPNNGTRNVGLNDVGDYLELPPVSNPQTMYYYDRLSSAPTAALNELTIEYFNGTVWAPISSHICTSIVYELVTVDLSSISGLSNVALRIFRSQDSRSAYIDDITIIGSTTAPGSTCDSIFITNIDILDPVSAQNPGNPFLICDTNDSIQLPGGAYATSAGTFNYTISGGASNGCDSTITTIVQTQSCGCFFDDISKTFWIKADTLLQNGGAPVNSGAANLWGNIVSNPLVPDLNTPTGAGTRTILQNDQSFNFNNSIDLVNAGFLRGGLPNNAMLNPSQGSMFVVASQPSLSFAYVVGTASTGVCGGNRCSSGFRANRSEYGSANSLFTGTTNANVANVMALTANANTNFQKNSLNGVVGTSNTASTIPVSTATVNYSACIGNWPGFNMTGKVAEAIAFNRELTADEYERVESYLALKYGTGLNHNYYASDFNGTTGTTTFFFGLGYDNNIAGIGRDDCFSLEQIKSHSVAPGAIITMALTDNGGSYNNPNGFNNNLEFLMWGNNAGSTSFSCSANTPAGYTSLYNRVWLSQQSGVVGTTSVAFDLSAANLTGPAADYALVVDTDGDGQYSDESPITGSILGNELVFDGVNLDNQTFTLVQNTAVNTTVNDQICNNDTYTLPSGIVVSQAGTYVDTLQTAQLCDSIVTTVLIPIICSCEFDLGPDTSFCAGGSIVLDASAGFDTYTWQDNSNAQTFTVNSTGTYYCTTSYLDLNNNLVTNGDFEQGNTGFTTDYGPGVGGAFGLLTNAGTYAINTSPSNVHNNFFSCSDNTSGSGNMMIVNGANTPNTNVWCQNITVNPNTDYLFSAWAMSLENTNLANVATLHFLVNGTQFGPNFSPSFTACDWQQFSTTWNSGANINIQICIESDVIAGNNDYAIDDIFFTPSCNYTDTINVTVNPIPTPNLGPDQSICQGSSANLDATTANATYLWQDGSTTTPTFTASTTGTYWVDVTVNSCTGRDSINIATNPILNTNLSENICAGDSLFLGGAWQSVAGIYYDTLVSAAFCDSILATTLNVQQVQIEAGTQTIVCENDLPALIFGNNQNQAGIYLDTISSALGCDSLIRSIELIINFTSTDTSFVSICEGDNFELNGQTLTSAGVYASDTSTNTSACDQYNFVSLSINPLPTAFLGNDTTINEGDFIELFVLNSDNNDSYSWLNSLGESYQGTSISANNTESASYYLSAENSSNCFSFDTLEVFVNPLAETSLFMPTAFSPNGDSYNDVFRIANYEDFETYTLRVYNRWGELIFDNKGYNVSWDGSYKGIQQNVGVYAYYIEATTLNGELLRASGNVSLIR